MFSSTLKGREYKVVFFLFFSTAFLPPFFFGQNIDILSFFGLYFFLSLTLEPPVWPRFSHFEEKIAYLKIFLFKNNISFKYVFEPKKCLHGCSLCYQNYDVCCTKFPSWGNWPICAMTFDKMSYWKTNFHWLLFKHHECKDL